MAAKTYSEETREAFYNVRVGGPKEKRLRKVELMGEHQPKPIFYIKVMQEQGEEFLNCSLLQEEFNKYLKIFEFHNIFLFKKSFVLFQELDWSAMYIDLSLQKVNKL